MRPSDIAANDWDARFQGSPLLAIPQGQTSGFVDLFLSEDRYLNGGYVVAWGVAPGDTASLQVIDPGFIPVELRGPEWPVLDQWCFDIPLPGVDGMPLALKTDFKGFINAGLGMRLVANAPGGQGLKVAVGYFLEEKR